jgi:hypothetical protein
MSKHECHCEQIVGECQRLSAALGYEVKPSQYPCPVHQPPRTAFAWEGYGPHDAYLRRDQFGREVAYASRAGGWTTWFDSGIVNAPDVRLAREQADLNLSKHGLLLEASSCPVSTPSPCTEDPVGRGGGRGPLMALKLIRAAFQKLVDGDLEWLLAQPDTLERRHLVTITRDYVRLSYEVEPRVQDATAANAVLRDCLRETIDALRTAKGALQDGTGGQAAISLVGHALDRSYRIRDHLGVELAGEAARDRLRVALDLLQERGLVVDEQSVAQFVGATAGDGNRNLYNEYEDLLEGQVIQQQRLVAERQAETQRADALQARVTALEAHACFNKAET